MKQLTLFKKEKTDFGGTLLIGKRKTRRPLDFKSPLHLVLKSENAKGKFALNPTNHKLELTIRKQAARFKVKIYALAINWTHAHLVLRITSRQQYNSFVRAATGAMVLKLRAPKGFFTLRPFTKICTWGRQFRNLQNYTVKNKLEARGLLFMPPQAPSKKTSVTSKNMEARGLLFKPPQAPSKITSSVSNHTLEALQDPLQNE
jgi:REP element-mobilizing transposase RayT